MANPSTPPEAEQSISAAELRRRLLASTPPPMAAAAVEAPPPEATGDSPKLPSWGSSADLLSRLRMPGKSGPVRIPEPRPQAAPPPEDSFPSVRPSVSRRTPIPGNRGTAYDASGSLSGSLHNNYGITGSDHSSPPSNDQPPSNEAHRLKSENKELRSLLSEMKQLLQEASETEAKYVEQNKEIATALEEKDRQIEELSSQLQSIEDQIARGELAAPPPIPKTRNEVEEWSDELEKESFKISQERKILDQERQQLREDEEALEKQMRQMEVSMARERALIARQETELKRLSAEIQHELETMQRGDATLRDQMSKFQRRAQEVLTAKPGGGGTAPAGRR